MALQPSSLIQFNIQLLLVYNTSLLSTANSEHNLELQKYYLKLQLYLCRTYALGSPMKNMRLLLQRETQTISSKGVLALLGLLRLGPARLHSGSAPVQPHIEQLDGPHGRRPAQAARDPRLPCRCGLEQHNLYLWRLQPLYL